MIKLIKKYKFKVFSHILKRYNVEFFFRDRMGILTKREFEDNFEYIFSTKNSCDAMPMMIALNEKIQNSNISMDVGANIGITTIWMAKNSKKVYAFEPELNNINRFNENLEVNNINNVKLVQKAVSDREGVATFNLFNSYGHHSLDSNHISKVKEVIQVKTITLDKFCKEKNIKKIDLLKIDVEGFEAQVLKGSKELLRNKSINMIIFEYSSVLLEKQKKDKKEVMNFLHNYDYQIFKLDGTKVNEDNINNLIQEDLYAIYK